MSIDPNKLPIPRREEIDGSIRSCKSQKNSNDKLQYISLAITVILLCIGAAYCPKCACIGTAALVSLGCSMGLIAISCLVLNVMLFLRGVQLERKIQFLQNQRNNPEI